MTLFEELPSLALDRLADRVDYAIIGPKDGRTRVANSRQAPYAAVCHIQRDFGDGRLSGCTGFLISPRVIVTAGHCVFNRLRQQVQGNGSPARIRITPGRNGAARRPFGFQWASRWYAHRSFVEDPRNFALFDFGIIVVARPFRGLQTSIPLSALTDAALQQVRAHRLLHIAGYPADKPNGTMWEHSERLDRVIRRVLLYSVDTCPGHSGSPVWVRQAQGSGVAAIAVHVAGPRRHARGAWGCAPGAPVAPAGSVNRGTRILPDMLGMTQAAASNTAHPSLRRFVPRR